MQYNNYRQILIPFLRYLQTMSVKISILEHFSTVRLILLGMMMNLFVQRHWNRNSLMIRSACFVVTCCICCECFFFPFWKILGLHSVILRLEYSHLLYSHFYMVLYIKLFKHPSYILQRKYAQLMYATMPVNICYAHIYILNILQYQCFCYMRLFGFYLRVSRNWEAWIFLYITFIYIDLFVFWYLLHIELFFYLIFSSSLIASSDGSEGILNIWWEWKWW